MSVRVYLDVETTAAAFSDGLSEIFLKKRKTVSVLHTCI